MAGSQPQSKPVPQAKPAAKKKVATPVAPDPKLLSGPPPPPPPEAPDAPPPGIQQGLTGPGRPRVRTASGADAVRALQVLPYQHPVTVGGGAMGPVTLVPGTTVKGRILLVAAP